MKIEDLQFSVRTYHCLKRAGIDTVERLSRMSDDELMKLRNFGVGCLNEVRRKIGAPRKTNADRIRDMSDRELLMFLVKHDVEQNRLRLESNGVVPTATQLAVLRETLCRTWGNWLQQPAEEGER
jgi:hypothetical protein